jgi:hypothetical protein
MAEAFFLDPDEAKTMGDIDYMRKARKVRKSFPSTKAWGKAFEVEEEISATQKNGFKSQQTSASEFTNSSSELKAETSQRRKADSNMDLFRNMAKDMRK